MKILALLLSAGAALAWASPIISEVSATAECSMGPRSVSQTIGEPGWAESNCSLVAAGPQYLPDGTYIGSWVRSWSQSNVNVSAGSMYASVQGASETHAYMGDLPQSFLKNFGTAKARVAMIVDGLPGGAGYGRLRGTLYASRDGHLYWGESTSVIAAQQVYCGSSECSTTIDTAFKVGVPFTVSLDVFGASQAQWSGNATQVYGGGGVSASISFGAFERYDIWHTEPDGTIEDWGGWSAAPIRLFDPATAVPEPGSAVMIVTGLAACVFRNGMRRNRRS
jgi:hypothetical protein